MGERRSAYRALVGKTKRNRTLGISKFRRWILLSESSISGIGSMYSIDLSHGRDREGGGCFEKEDVPSVSVSFGGFFDISVTY